MIRRALVFLAGAGMLSFFLGACSGGSASADHEEMDGTNDGSDDGGAGCDAGWKGSDGDEGPKAEVLWNYHRDDSEENYACTSVAVGGCSQYVFVGFHGGGAKMFSMEGDGEPLWEIDSGNFFRVVAAETADIFYGVSSNEGFKVYRFNGASSSPIWTYDGAAEGYRFMNPTFGERGMFECTPDGSVLAVGAIKNDRLAILFFNAGSPTPIGVYRDNGLFEAQDLHLNSGGTKCIFHSGYFVHRVDVATQTLEYKYEVDGEAAAFAISRDASNVFHGLGILSAYTWDGAAYQKAWNRILGGEDAGFAAVEAEDGEELLAAVMKNNFSQMEVQRYQLSAGKGPLWVYATPPRQNGELQQQPSAIDVSDDGEWIAVGTWGTADNVHPEFFVLRDSNPTQTFFSIDTVGSVNDVDISANGHYAALAAKGVHANIPGSGCDVYAVKITF
jgi:hypothetical protein